MEALKRFANVYDQFEERVISISFMIVMSLIFLQVVFRYVIQESLVWSEELVRYIYVWECWVGISLVQRYDRHLKLTFLTERMKEKVQHIIEIAVNIVCIITAVALLYLGIKLVVFTGDLGTTSPVLKIPMTVYYMCLPIGCFLYLLRVLAQTVEKIKDRGVSIQ